ncbi:Bro-N domain-containing protein [Kerstersia gyiorum]|uniref:BRO-N domain-containing protein n=1 Tax=Kerstersia gyiorum TaxID=206506 RepID=UPI00214F73B9|nr:Bro-N domain-containing protein [Kerstersia gyiorum]MCR4158831.1 Bro-N domain-containing protein [Kerstersia gyiorum]
MNIIPFQSPDFSVRVVEVEGETWFVGKDVAEALGYANSSKAMGDHCKGVAKRYPLQTAGGMQEVRVINEADLFRLVVNSQLPSAEKFERWVFEEVLPSIRKTGSYQVGGEPVKQATEALKIAPLAVRAARALGLDKNTAAISANQFVRKLTGMNLLEGFGATHLAAENQEALYFTPTELGKMLGGLSAQKVNLLLAGAGLQAKVGEHWKPLDAGKDFARLYDTGKKHSDGASVQQIKWSDTVLPLLKKEEVA